MYFRRSHVKEDLQPYNCIFDSCPKSNEFYSTTSAWARHMELFHASTVWQCSLCGTHQPASFPSGEDLKEHMQLSHDNENDFTDSQLPLLVDKSHRSVPLIIENCPFCTKPYHEVGDMAAHVAEELLEFALEALPWDSGSPDPSASCQRGKSLSDASDKVVANDDDLNLSILDDSDLDIDGASESIDSYKNGVKRPLTEWNAILVSRKNQRLHHDISLIMLCFQPVTIVDQAFLVQRYINDRHATHLVHPSSTAMSSMAMIGSQPEDKTDIQASTQPEDKTEIQSFIPLEGMEEVQAFIQWIYSPNTQKKGCCGPDNNLSTAYIPQAALEKKLTKSVIAVLLKELFQDLGQLARDTNVVKKHYLRPFAILLSIGSGRMIRHFVHYLSLRDDQLPFSDKPKDFPNLTTRNLFQAFHKAQWHFCPVKFEYDMSHRLQENFILPIVSKEEVGNGGSATLYKIVIDEGYNELLPSNSSSTVPKPSYHHFAQFSN